MMAGPHITAFSPVAPCIIFTSALASARLVLSESASTNAVTLTLVALVLFSAICPSPDPPNFALRHDHIKPVIVRFARQFIHFLSRICLLYTSDAADDLLCVDLGGRRIIKKKNTTST